MADFAAVLKKTIDAQKDQSPELRQRVYAKARSTIEQKLLAANASEAVSTRQREMLDSAIAEVEAFYAPPAIEPEAEPVPSIADAPEASVHEEPAIKAPVAPAADPLDEFLKSEDRTHRAAEPTSVAPDIEAFDSQDDGAVSSPQRGDEWKQDRDDEAKFTRKSAAVFDDEGPSRSYKGLITALVAVLVLGGVGYAGWSNKDRLQELAS
ncbi:transcriptional regulator, partial [Paraburkholderia aspalathi]|nr:transcriptional regulator [Paraburkholderia aspalathi]